MKEKKVINIKPEKIENQPIQDEVQRSYLDYAMSVIVSRALPDVRDGLKPVQRRILYAMWQMGLRANTKHRKSATVIGEVLGKYHPHGDMAVYDTMVRMAQDFSLRYPLVNGQGNFGSVDGDSAAAYRYTEARLSVLAQELLFDLEKDTVDWTNNYDGTTQEPIILPGKVPNLLINGAAGIAVGVATNIPPHNLNEVCDACSYLIDHPKAETNELLKFIQGPDFPTGGIVYSVDSLEDSYNFGKGKIIIRAKTEIIGEDTVNPQIIITEIPYMVQKSLLLEKIAELVQEKKIQEIRNIRDLSNKEGIKIIIDLKKGTSPEKALNRLFHASPLEVSYHFNFLALIDGLQVKSLSLQAMLNYYLEHRKIVIRRRTEWELAKVKKRIHILEGFEIALINIDRVIKIIKESKDKETAKVNLMKSFKLSEEQTVAILELRLWQLSRLESQKIKDELKELKLRQKALEEILADAKKILNVIKEELKEIKEKYNQPRKTKIIRSALKEFKEEDLIHEQPTIVTITNEGYIKRVSPDQFRVQERGGKGTIVVKAKEGDVLSHLIFTSTISELLFFTNQGKLFKLRTYDISEKSKNSKGDALVNFLTLNSDEKIAAVLPKLPKNYFSLVGFKEDTEQKFLLMVTQKGIIKRVKIEEFDKSRKNGLIVINLDRDDRLVDVKPSTGEDEIFLITRQGQGIRFKEKEARHLSRGAKGIKGMRLAKDDEIMALEVISKKKSPQAKMFTITENGYGKASVLSSFRLQKRAGSGIKIHRVLDKTGKITHAFFVDEKNLPNEMKGDLIISSFEGQLLRIQFKDVPSLGRVSQGVRLIRFKDSNDKVSSVTLI
jgi:DNA gyrase subunit A